MPVLSSVPVLSSMRWWLIQLIQYCCFCNLNEIGSDYTCRIPITINSSLPNQQIGMICFRVMERERERGKGHFSCPPSGQERKWEWDRSEGEREKLSERQKLSDRVRNKGKNWRRGTKIVGSEIIHFNRFQMLSEPGSKSTYSLTFSFLTRKRGRRVNFYIVMKKSFKIFVIISVIFSLCLSFASIPMVTSFFLYMKTWWSEKEREREREREREWKATGREVIII